MRLYRPFLLSRVIFPGAFFRINDHEKVLYLTFDDGPDPVSTPEVIDILAKYNVCAMFFLNGRNAEMYPHLLSAIKASGHVTGNHGYDHLDGWFTSTRNYLSNVSSGASFSSERWFRPPYGSYNDDIRAIAKEEGASIVLWNLTPDDWKNPGEAIIRKRVTSSVKDGSIVLLHVREQTLSALPRLIQELTDMGYELVGLSEIM